MRRLRALLVIAAMVTAGLVPFAFATAASANVLQISIDCQSVTFNYTLIPLNETDTATEKVAIDGTIVASKTFTFTTSTGSFSDTVSISGTNGQTVGASSTFTTSDGTFTNIASQTLSGCSAPPPPCPSRTSIHVRWHYSGEISPAMFTSGSWSATTAFGCPGTVSMGPQAMEGNLQLAPGATLKAGYDFTIPGNNNSVFVTFTSPAVTFNVKCASGMTPTTSTITVPMPIQTYNSTNGGSWFPSGNQSSSLVYQGSISVPDVCNGGKVSFQNGGTFTATIS
jgi:hypothetical protein